MSEEISLDIALSKEEMDKIKDLLFNAPCVRHYAIELNTGEYLDLVEYKDYEELQQRIDKAIKMVETYTTLNPQRIRQELLEVLKGDNND